VYNEQKATQAAAYLLKKFGGTHNYMALLKLLYLSDRKALLESGYSITGDLMYSLPHGPVLSNILSLMSRGAQGGPWMESIQQSGRYQVTIVKDPGLDDLSEFESSILDTVYTSHGALSQWQLEDLTHELPEWEDPGASNKLIEPRSILEAEGIPAVDIQRLSDEAEARWYMTEIPPWKA